MRTPSQPGSMTPASPTLLQDPPPLLPSRALKVGDFFVLPFIPQSVSGVMAGRRHATVAMARPYTVPCMKKLMTVALVAGALSTARAADYALQAFDFSELGTVETVNQVRILELLPNVLEHSVRR